MAQELQRIGRQALLWTSHPERGGAGRSRERSIVIQKLRLLLDVLAFSLLGTVKLKRRYGGRREAVTRILPQAPGGHKATDR
jgi:hypothetical protein